MDSPISSSKNFPQLTFQNKNLINSLAHPLQSGSNLSSNLETRRKKVFVASKQEFGKTIMSKLNGQFNSCNNYFEDIEGVIIGRRPSGPVETLDGKDFVYHSVVGGQHIIDYLKRQKLRKANKPRGSIKDSLNHIGIISNNTSSKKKLQDRSGSTVSIHISKVQRDNNNKALNNSKGSCEPVDNQGINDLESKFKKLSSFNRRCDNFLCERLNDSWEGNLFTLNSNFNVLSKIKSQENGYSQYETSNNLVASTSNQTQEKRIKEDSPYSTKFQSKLLKKTYEVETSNLENKEVLETIPYEFRRQLLQQEKTINLYESRLSNGLALERYLQAKSNKRNKNDLLINSSDSYLLKAELKSIIDSKIPEEKKRGIYNWIVSLRKPKNFKGERTSYINLGTNNNPSWHHLKETSPNDNEKIVKPSVNFTDHTSKISDISYKEAAQELINLQNYIVN